VFVVRACKDGDVLTITARERERERERERRRLAKWWQYWCRVLLLPMLRAGRKGGERCLASYKGVRLLIVFWTREIHYPFLKNKKNYAIPS
jgi:hypothetical protein